MKNSMTLHLSVIILILSLNAFSEDSKISQERIKMLCSSVDNSINGIELTATLVSTLSKKFYQNIILKDSDKTATSSVEQKRNIKVSYSSGIMHVEHNILPSREFPNPYKYRDIWELGKSISIHDNKDNSHMVTISESGEIPSHFTTTSALVFGRGLSQYHGKVMNLVQDSNNKNIYLLSIFNDDNTTYVKYTLDSSKGYCWTKAEMYNPEGEIIRYALASDYHNVGHVWIPYRCQYTQMDLDTNEFYFKDEYTVTNCNIIEDEIATASRITALNYVNDNDIIIK